MSSDDEDLKNSSKGSTYVKFRNRKSFPEWKRKTEALATQQGYLRFLESNVNIKSEEEIENLYDEWQDETDAVMKKKKRSTYIKEQKNRKLGMTASCMLMLAMPASMSKKLEEVKNEPNKMWEKIHAKYDKKGNNKLSNFYAKNGQTVN